MQIIQIIQYAGMMVLHKGMLEDVFLISLETTAHFNLKKVLTCMVFIPTGPGHRVEQHTGTGAFAVGYQMLHSSQSLTTRGTLASHLLSLNVGYPSVIQR